MGPREGFAPHMGRHRASGVEQQARESPIAAGTGPPATPRQQEHQRAEDRMSRVRACGGCRRRSGSLPGASDPLRGTKPPLCASFPYGGADVAGALVMPNTIKPQRAPLAHNWARPPADGPASAPLGLLGVDVPGDLTVTGCLHAIVAHSIWCTAWGREGAAPPPPPAVASLLPFCLLSPLPSSVVPFPEEGVGGAVDPSPVMTARVSPLIALLSPLSAAVLGDLGTEVPPRPRPAWAAAATLPCPWLQRLRRRALVGIALW